MNTLPAFLNLSHVPALSDMTQLSRGSKNAQLNARTRVYYVCMYVCMYEK